MPDCPEDIMRRLERALMDHDRHASELAGKIDNNTTRMGECALRIEHSLEKMSDSLTTLVKNGNGNGNGGSHAMKALDLSMKVILTLVGLLAMLTLGPASVAKLLGQ